MRAFLILLALLAPAAAPAQEMGCPLDAHQQIYDLTRQASEKVVPELGEIATGLLRGCGPERALLGQIIAMFTAAGIATEPPARFVAHANAYKTVLGLARNGAGSFEPVPLTGPDGAAIEWAETDERNAYWDLMFAMSSDFLTHGVHADLYMPGKTEELGCGLYPAEEASALARHGAANADGGELMARLSFLGRACDTPEHETSGYVARYFAEHARTRAADEGYAGLTGGDIRAGLQTFLTQHLDGADESPLFSVEELAELRAY